MRSQLATYPRIVGVPQMGGVVDGFDAWLIP